MLACPFCKKEGIQDIQVPLESINLASHPYLCSSCGPFEIHYDNAGEIKDFLENHEFALFQITWIKENAKINSQNNNAFIFDKDFLQDFKHHFNITDAFP